MVTILGRGDLEEQLCLGFSGCEIGAETKGIVTEETQFETESRQ